MEPVNRPVVYLAFAHESKKTKGTKTLKLLEDSIAEISDRFVTRSCDSIIDIHREGTNGQPYGFEVLSEELRYPFLNILHIASEASDSNKLNFNALGSKRKEVDLDNLFLDHLNELKIVLIDGGATMDLVEKFLFAGAPVVIGMSYTGDSSSAEKFKAAFYESVLKGLSLKEGFENSRTDEWMVREIASDPYEYWEAKEKEDPGAPFSWGMYYLSANTDALEWNLIDPAEVLDNREEEVQVEAEVQVEDEVVVEVEVQAEADDLVEEPVEEDVEVKDEVEEVVEIGAGWQSAPEVKVEEQVEAEVRAEADDVVEEQKEEDVEVEEEVEGVVEVGAGWQSAPEVKVEELVEEEVQTDVPEKFYARTSVKVEEHQPFEAVRRLETRFILARVKAWSNEYQSNEPLKNEVNVEKAVISQPEKTEPKYESETRDFYDSNPSADSYDTDVDTYAYDTEENFAYEAPETSPEARAKAGHRSSVNWKRYAGIGLGILGVITGIFLIFNLTGSIGNAGEPAYLTAFESSENFNVLILPFYESPNCKTVDAYDEITVRDRLNTQEESNDIGIQAVFLPEGACPKNSEDAKSLGEVYNADLVIWGDSREKRKESDVIKINYISLGTGAESVDLNSSNIGVQAFNDIDGLKEGTVAGHADDIMYWTLGVVYLLDGNYQTALGYLQQITAKNISEYAMVHHMMAKCYHGLNKFDEVLKHYTDAIRVNPQDANAYYNRGRLFQRLHQNDQALADYAEATRIKPNHLNANYYRRVLLDEEDADDFYIDPALIEDEFANLEEPVYEIAEETDGATRSGTMEDLEFRTPQEEPELAKGSVILLNEEAANKRIASKREAELNQVLSNAYQLEKDGNSTAALSAYEEAIAMSPQDPGLYFSRGSLYEKTGEYTKALLDYTSAIRLNPREVNYFNSRAYLFERVRMYYKAIEDYSSLINLNPEESNYFLYRGKAYQYVRKNDQALKDFQEAIRRNPLDASGYYFRGKLHVEMKNSEKALADFTKAIAINPGYVSAYRDRGQMYLAGGQEGKALLDFNKILELNPSDAKILAIRADILLDMGEFDRAEADLKRAIEIDPNNKSYKRMLSEITPE